MWSYGMTYVRRKLCFEKKKPFMRQNTPSDNQNTFTRIVLSSKWSCVRSDRPSPRSDRPTLSRFRFRVVSLDIRDCFMVMASRWIRYVTRCLGRVFAVMDWESAWREEIKLSSTLCFTGFRRSNRRLTCGQTGGKAAVRPVALGRSDRRRKQAAAGDFDGSTDRSTSVRPTFIRRSDRRVYFGQTAIINFESNFYFR
uniref:OSJNBb0066J23.19 protein n=1 Tax=Oryza sativa subsp. japonica TaxID=39947 RepID=Q7X5Y0_ORYSJ|nr:OSJNBb0066J23.19 [Oryza sativa Japonica Group]